MALRVSDTGKSTVGSAAVQVADHFFPFGASAAPLLRTRSLHAPPTSLAGWLVGWLTAAFLQGLSEHRRRAGVRQLHAGSLHSSPSLRSLPLLLLPPPATARLPDASFSPHHSTCFLPEPLLPPEAPPPGYLNILESVPKHDTPALPVPPPNPDKSQGKTPWPFPLCSTLESSPQPPLCKPDPFRAATQTLHLHPASDRSASLANFILVYSSTATTPVPVSLWWSPGLPSSHLTYPFFYTTK